MTREQFELLVKKMYDRLTADRRSLTLDLASGVGIGMGGKEAYDAWMKAQDPVAGGNDAAIARQRATFARLQGLFGSGVVRAKVN